MEIGDKINLKNGHTATVTKIGLSDFIGDPRPVYIQYIDSGKVIVDVLMSNELMKK